MRKYLGFILLCLFLLSPSGLSAQDKSNITNSIYFGGGYSFVLLGQSGEGYLGVETNFGNPVVSLLNNFGVGYLDIFAAKPDIFSAGREEGHAIDMYYSLGLRVYLGTPYVFMDFDTGVAGYLSTQHKKEDKDIFWLGTIGLGFNIPLSKEINLQISASGGIYLFLCLQAKVGLQFKL